VEIKCQLDATEVFIADLIACSTCFGHHYAHHQEFKNNVQWLLPVVLRAVVLKLLVWCGAELHIIVQEDGWVPGPVWTGAENLALPGFDPRTVQPVDSRYTDYATRHTHFTNSFLK